MPTVITNMFQSKKFIFTFVATILTVFGGKYGFVDDKTVQTILEILWPTYIAAQGLSDLSAKYAEGKIADTQLHHQLADARQVETMKQIAPLIQQGFEAVHATNEAYKANAAAIHAAHKFHEQEHAPQYGAPPVATAALQFFFGMSDANLKTLQASTTDPDRRALLEAIVKFVKRSPVVGVPGSGK